MGVNIILPHQPTAQRLPFKFLTMQQQQGIDSLTVVRLDQDVAGECLFLRFFVVLWQYLGVLEVCNLFAEKPQNVYFLVDLWDVSNSDVKVFILVFCQFLFKFELGWNNVLTEDGFTF